MRRSRIIADIIRYLMMFIATYFLALGALETSPVALFVGLAFIVAYIGVTLGYNWYELRETNES